MRRTRERENLRRRRMTQRKDTGLRLYCRHQSSTAGKALDPRAGRPCLEHIVTFCHFGRNTVNGLQNQVVILAPRLIMYLIARMRAVN
jgi:hypothetical protein